MKEHLKTLFVIILLLIIGFLFFNFIRLGWWFMRASKSIDEAREKQERTEQILEAVQSESVSREEEADNTETLTPDGGLAEDGIEYICNTGEKSTSEMLGESIKSFIATTTEMTTEEIKSYIRETARRYGVDENKMLLISKCESNYQNIPNSKYGNNGGMGIFQFIPQSWDYVMDKMGRSGDPYDIKLNIEAAAYLLSTEGDKHWEKSSACWRFIPKGICPPIVCPPWLLLSPDCECVESVEIKTKL